MTIIFNKNNSTMKQEVNTGTVCPIHIQIIFFVISEYEKNNFLLIIKK